MSKSNTTQMNLRISDIQLSILFWAIILLFETKDWRIMCTNCQQELVKLIGQLQLLDRQLRKEVRKHE